MFVAELENFENIVVINGIEKSEIGKENITNA